MQNKCYHCTHVANVPGDVHKACNNARANVVGHPHGIKRGWFMWPFNFDPYWLESCDGYEMKGVDRLGPLLKTFK